MSFFYFFDGESGAKFNEEVQHLEKLYLAKQSKNTDNRNTSESL